MGQVPALTASMPVVTFWNSMFRFLHEEQRLETCFVYKFLPFIGFGALQPMSGNGIHGFKASKMTWLDLLNLICTCLSSYQTSRKRFQDKMQTIRPFLRDRLYDSFLAHELCQDGPVALVSQAESANFQRPWLRLRAHGSAKFAAAMSLDVEMHGRCMELNWARFHRPGLNSRFGHGCSTKDTIGKLKQLPSTIREGAWQSSFKVAKWM
jgi:hypothetical protein